jgi:hypothetical protein
LGKVEIITVPNEQMKMIGHHDVSANGHTKLVPSSANVAFECAVSCAQVSDLLPMNCADRYEVQRRIVGLKDLLKSRRTTLNHHEFSRPTRPPLHLRANPDRPNDFMIFDRHHVCFLLQLFVSGRKHDERARSTQ